MIFPCLAFSGGAAVKRQKNGYEWTKSVHFEKWGWGVKNVTLFPTDRTTDRPSRNAFILFYFILFYYNFILYFVLFCFVLFYFILFCFILFCFTLFYFVLFIFIYFFLIFYFILFFF